MPRIRQLASELRRALTEFEPGRYSIAECGALAVELGKAAEIVAVPAHEHELLDLAKRAGSGPVKRQAHKRYQESLPAEELHERRKHAREFVHWEDKLGMIHLHAALVPEVGQRLVNRLEAETDRLWLRLRRDGTHHTREQLTADAFARLIDPDHPLPRGGVEIVFVVDLAAWTRGHAHPSEVCHILGGGPVPVAVVRQRLTDAFVKVALHDGTKVDTIVHYGRKRPALLQSVLDLGAPPDSPSSNAPSKAATAASASSGTTPTRRQRGPHVGAEPRPAVLAVPSGRDRARPQGRQTPGQDPPRRTGAWAMICRRPVGTTATARSAPRDRVPSRVHIVVGSGGSR